MAQIFHPSANTLARLSIFGGAFLALGALVVTYMIIDSPYQTGVDVVKDQPVPFSHEHHVNGLGIDCRYCHTSVEESAYAGMPPTHTCMSCHSQIWTDSPMLAPVRESLALEEPIAWNRVHDLPDYSYFNHAIHVKKGVGCASCHGQVDEMPLPWKVESMNMGWCLECHRNPERHLRPREEIYDLDWTFEDDERMRERFGSRAAMGLALAEEYQVPTMGHDTPLTNCAVCHR